MTLQPDDHAEGDGAVPAEEHRHLATCHDLVHFAGHPLGDRDHLAEVLLAPVRAARPVQRQGEIPVVGNLDPAAMGRSTSPARRNCRGAFSWPMPWVPALDGTPTRVKPTMLAPFRCHPHPARPWRITGN